MSSAEGTSVWPIAICLATVYIVWGTTYFAIKVGIQGLPTFFLVGTRFVVAGIVLLAWQMLRGRPMPRLPEWRNAGLLGLLFLVMGNGSIAVAEHRISSGATVALGSVVPLATALWSGVFGRWPRRMEWVAIAVGGVGATVMLLGRDLRASFTGALVVLFGVTSWSLGTVLSRRVRVPPGATGFGAEMLSAGVVALALSAALREPWSLAHAPRVWYAWGYLVVCGSLIGFSAFRYVVERVSPTLASTYAYVNPLVALLVGGWLGGESFSSGLLIGLPLVLAGVGLHAWAHARAALPARRSARARLAANPAAGR
ncbi:MAG TPA: EamA family transporter [Steroidobacteraceae bacterium]|nr:EamA family transporter [Steroidobacteraceae bacterium]